jgi:multiple sugar transport system permease protein
MPNRGRAVSRLQRREEIEAFIFLAPWIAGFLIFQIVPIVASGALALSDYNIIKPPVFVGLRNFQRMFLNDPLFWQSLKVTAIYVLASVPLQVVLGYAVALLLNQKVIGLSVFRTIFYLPSVVSGVAVAMMWLWVFQPDLGIVDTFLRQLGIDGPKWLSDPTWALAVVIFTTLWGIGGGMLVYLAGLQGVPTHLYEAAELDGAGTVRKFIHITLPMTSPVIFFTLLMGMIGSWQVFTAGSVMTGGGPGNSTLFYVLYLYRNGWQYFKMGYASALAWVLCFIILLLTLVVFRISGRLVYFEGQLKD